MPGCGVLGRTATTKESRKCAYAARNAEKPTRFRRSSVWEIGLVGRRQIGKRSQASGESDFQRGGSLKKRREGQAALLCSQGAQGEQPEAAKQRGEMQPWPPAAPRPPLPHGMLLPLWGWRGGSCPRPPASLPPQESEIICGCCKTEMKGSEGAGAERQEEAEGVNQKERMDCSPALKLCKSWCLLCTPSTRQREVFPH